MNKKTLVALGFLAVVGALLAYQLTREDPHARRELALDVPDVPDLDRSAIDSVILKEKDKPDVVLEKQGDTWRVTAPVEDDADPTAIDQLLRGLDELIVKDVVAESSESHAQLQVGPEHIVTVIPRKGGTELATLHVGRTGNLRVGDKNTVYRQSGLPRYAVARDVRAWRDRRIVRFEQKDLARIEAVFADGRKVAIEKKTEDDKDIWTLVEGKEYVGGDLDETQGGSLASMLSRLDASDFPEGIDRAAAGLEEPKAKVTAILADGARHEVWIGDAASASPDADVYVTRPDAQRVWLVRGSTAEALSRPPEQWRNKVLAKIAGDQVKKLELRRKKDRYVFARVPGEAAKWTAEHPRGFGEVNSPVIQSMATSFLHLRANEVVVDADARTAGLKNPQAILTLTLADGKTFTLTVGNARDKVYYVSASSQPGVYTLNEHLIGRFLKDAADLKKPAS